MKFEPKNIIKDTLWENQSLQKLAALTKKKRFSFFFFFTKVQTCYSVDFNLCLTSTFVQSLLLNLNTHHSWIVRSLWPRNSFKYQIYNKRSETAQKNCEYQRVSTVKICLKSATAANKKCLLFECRKKKFASPCTILRRFCPFVCALFRL